MPAVEPTSPATYASLQTVLVAYAAVSRLALADTDVDAMLSGICEQIARTLPDGRCGVFEEVDDHLALRSGTGWEAGTAIAAPVPVRWLLPDLPAPVHSLDDFPALAAMLRESTLDGPGDGAGGMCGFVAPFRTPEHRDAVLVMASDTPIESVVAPGLVQLSADLISGGWARRSLDQELRDSRQRLVEAQELAHMGSYDWNIPTDTNLWSDELFRIYGHEPQSFNATYDRFLSMLDPDCRDEIIAVHQQAYATGEPYRMRERIIRPDGETRTLESTGEVIMDSQGRPLRMRGVCIDITDRLRVEAELDRFEQADQRRHHALEINDNVVQGLTTLLWSFEQDDVDGARDIAGRTLEAARGMMTRLLEVNGEFEPTELVRTAAASSMRTPATPGYTEVDVAETGPDGGRDRSERPQFATIAVVDDSSDIRLLLCAQLRLRLDVAIVAEGGSGSDAVRIAETHRPDVMLLDLAMPDGDGLSAIPEILAVAPETRIIVLSGFSADILADQVVDAGAVDYVEKGSFDALTAVLDEQLEILGISDEAMPERSIPDHPGRAGEPGDSRADIGHLVHELRTPVTVIAGIAELFRRERDALPSATTDELLGTLVRNTTNLQNLLDRVSAGFQLSEDGLRYEQQEIVTLIEAIAADLVPVLGGHAVTIVGDHVHADVDPLRFRQVITNLLTNAARYAPDGTAISVDVSAGGDEALQVAVSDVGPGVPADLVDTIFEPFVRDRSRGDGLGLGLHLSKLIAHAHGGVLRLDTSASQGARFTLSLPASRTVSSDR